METDVPASSCRWYWHGQLYAVRIEDPVVIKKILTHLEEKSSVRSAFAI
jgi:hypothetical protein